MSVYNKKMLVLAFISTMFSCGSHKVKSGDGNKINEQTSLSIREPNTNELINGYWKIDSIKLKESTIYPQLQAYAFKAKSNSASYLKQEGNYVREDHVGLYRFYNDTLTIYIDNPSSGSNQQTWRLDTSEKSKIIMHALYITSRNEQPIIYMTKTSHEKLTSFSEE